MENAIDAMDKVEDRFSNFDGYIDQNLENLLDASGELIEKNRNEFINALKSAELTSDEICDVVRKVAANDAIDTNQFLQGFTNDEIEDLIKRIDNTDGVSKDVIDDLIVSKYSLCFEAGTLITTQRGLVAIENIQVGDQVLSRNMLTGENEFKPVLQTFVNEKNEFIRVHVNGEVIKATPEHPFYVVGSGFIQASNLQEGMTLMLSTGEYVIIDQLENDLKDQLVNTYNFRVKDNNNYYVGSQGLLVHNLCSIEDLTSADKVIDANWYRDFDALMEKGEIKKEHIDAIRKKLNGKVGADFDKVMDQLDILEGTVKGIDFSTFRNFDSHYDIHVKGVGRKGAVAEYGTNFTKEDYFNTANEIASKKVDNLDIFSKMQGDTTVIYQKSTNDIVFKHKDGTIGSMFKPKFNSTNPDAGWNYFNNLK